MRTNGSSLFLCICWCSAVIVHCFVVPIGRPRSNSRLREVTSMARHGLRDSFVGTMGRLFYPDRRRASLKEEILNHCQILDREISANRSSTVATLVKNISKVSPISNPSRTPALFKTWNLTWTTEPDIQQMYQYKNVSQTLTPGNWKWEIERNENSRNIKADSFETVWRFLQSDGVTHASFQGQLEIEAGRRMVYRLGRKRLLWFDTVYLDDSLRIDVDQNADIYVFRSYKALSQHVP